MGSTHGDGGSRATPLRDVEAAIPAPVGPAEVSAAPQGVVVVVEQLDYSVPGRGGGGCWRRSGGGDIYLLQGVSAHLPATQLTAIIGPSGCGKTTLLDLVAGRKTTGKLGPQSRILHNGRPPTAAFLRANVAYTEQQDTLLPMLTTREMLLYTAHLKHGRRRSLAEKQAQVEELICKLHLEDCCDTQIGSPMARGVSGGEAKRANIGIALVSSPKLLLMDEPTTGLDAFNAHSVVEVICALAREGITVCASVHSPSPLTFNLFDRVLMMQRGRTVYFGRNGDPMRLYFAETFPDLRPMRHEEGVYAWTVDVTAKAGKDRHDTRFSDAYEASTLRRDNDSAIQALLAASASKSGNGAHLPGGSGGSEQKGLAGLLARDLGTSSPMWWALLTLWSFRSLKAWRRPDFLGARLGDKVLILFLIVTLYWGLGDSANPADATSIAAILFIVVVMSGYGAMGIMPVLVIERPVFLRERSDGLYRPITYLVYKAVEELAVAWAASIPYCLLMYYLIQLRGSFFLLWMVYLVSISIAVMLTLLFGSLFSSIDVAGATLPSFMSVCLFFSGFLLPFPNLPVYWKWASVIDFMRYAWGALVVNQFSDTDILVYGDQTLLQFYGLDHVIKWAWLGWEVLFLAVFTAGTWWAMATMKHARR